MQDLLKVLLGSTITLILGGIGFLIKWYLERRADFLQIEKYERLLTLREKLNKNKISLEDLKEIEKYILGKREKIEYNIKKVTLELKNINEFEKIPKFHTQAEMNEYAINSFKRVEEKLDFIIKKLKQYLDKERILLLEEAQEVWLKFREKHADFVASQYKGGSIQPLIYYSELERLTIERIASLQSELEELENL